MYYPAAVIAVAIIVSAILLVYVIPQFEGIFQSFGADLPAFTRMIVDLSHFMQASGIYLLVGAIVIIEHYVFPKIGYTRYWTSIQEKLLNWPALLSWFIAIVVAYFLWINETIHLFFLFVPVWFLTALSYLVLSPLAGARKAGGKTSEAKEASEKHAERFETKTETSQGSRNWISLIAGIIALVALVFCFVIPLMVFVQGAENYTDNLAFLKKSFIWLMIIYFISGMYYARSENKQ